MDFAIDNFVTTKTGEAIRLLPFGPLFKGGKRWDITPEFAKKFKLPHFKPPVKLGSHDEPTPAGGFIVGLEVREDGLYGLTEWTEKGQKAVETGDYRYHSPEIVWEGAGFENPETGEKLNGPFIIGTALLHTPHLGERAALYTAELEEHNMTDTVTVPASWLEKLFDKFGAKEVTPEPEPVVTDSGPQGIDVTQFDALRAERDQLAAQIAEIQAEQQAAQQRLALTAELTSDRFGSIFAGEAANEAVGVLIGMTQEQRDWILKNFAALAAQVNEGNLFAETGSSGDGVNSDNPVAVLNAAVQGVMSERKVDYSTALDIVSNEQPALIAAAYPKG